MNTPAREVMKYDVVVVGAGPAGLTTAIRLKQKAAEAGIEVSVCVVEKGSEVGAHLLSGAILERRALDELFPGAEALGAPLGMPVDAERFLLLTANTAWPLFSPPSLSNKGNRIVSLGDFARWLKGKAEALGVEIYPGFAAAEVLYDPSGSVAGIATGDMGVKADGTPGPNHTPGVELRARQTVFAEGCRGSLTKLVSQRFALRDGVDPQTYGLGIKELWEVDPAVARPGLVTHSIGWPLDMRTYGGGWLYHMGGNVVSVGLVVGLDYANPHLDPFGEFQRFKAHPANRAVLETGRRIAFGARAISEGGFQSIPRLTFPGGLLAGDSAGFVNVPKIKGIHTAMKSGLVAGEALAAHFAAGAKGREVLGYRPALEASWLWDELRGVRNVRPAFRFGMLPAVAYSGLEMMVLRGKGPWTLRHRHPDHAGLKKASEAPRIVYPKPDGKVVFDRPSSVHLANVAHEHDQPAHLKLTDPAAVLRVNLALHESPETRFCPAGVFEILRGEDGGSPMLQLNPANCVHCKTCDIKDPAQNIVWTVPEGGAGPNYPGGM